MLKRDVRQTRSHPAANSELYRRVGGRRIRGSRRDGSSSRFRGQSRSPIDLKGTGHGKAQAEEGVHVAPTIIGKQPCASEAAKERSTATHDQTGSST
jgi:hypothetical protein